MAGQAPKRPPRYFARADPAGLAHALDVPVEPPIGSTRVDVQDLTAFVALHAQVVRVVLVEMRIGDREFYCFREASLKSRAPIGEMVAAVVVERPQIPD